jgi:hypothetical protein
MNVDKKPLLSTVELIQMYAEQTTGNKPTQKNITYWKSLTKVQQLQVLEKWQSLAEQKNFD